MKLRAQRVAELVHQCVAKELLRQLPGRDLSVARVEVSDDLRHATVWFTRAKDARGTEAEAMDMLAQHHNDLSRAVAKSLKTKFTPKLHLRLDGGSQHAQRIDELLKKLK